MLRWLTKELVLTLLQSAVIALILQFTLVSFGTAANPIGTWAVAAVSMLAFRLHRTALPATGRKRSRAGTRRSSSSESYGLAATSVTLRTSAPGQPERWVEPLPETLEHRFTRMYRHVDRLSYAVVAPRHYHAGVRPVLAELARDRLHRYHGVDLAEDPAQARSALGDDLWRALTEPRETAPTTKELDRWLTRLEQLDPARAPHHPAPA